MKTHHTPGLWQWRIASGGPPDEDGFSTPSAVDWQTWRSVGFYDNPELVAPQSLDAYGEPVRVLSAGGGEYTPVQGNSDEERNANARLIAAAPELVAMVAELAEAYHDARLEFDGEAGEPALVTRAKALLTKAGVTL
jgi:hypothetical protein